jgi:parvulin-like peptidyl-prolyl isomerase
MKKIKSSTKIFAISTVIVAAVIIAAFFAMQNKDKVIAAKVNNTKIYKSEVQEKLDKIFTAQNFGGKETKSPAIESLPGNVIEILVKEIYLEKAILKKAAELKITKLKSVQEKLKESRTQIIRQAYIEEVAKREVTDEDVLDKYAKLSDDLKGKKEYMVYHIVTKTQKESWIVRAALKRGKYKNFDKVAKQYSIDKSSAENGGKLGYVLEDNIISEVATVIKKLKLNYISKPIKTKFGWHTIKVTEVRDAQPLPFDKVKENIKNGLKQEATNNINEKLTKDIEIDLLIKVKDSKKEETSEAEENEEEENDDDKDDEEENDKDE